MRSHLISLIAFFCLQSAITFSQSTVNYSFSNDNTSSLTDMSSGATNILLPNSTTGDFSSSVNNIGFDFWLMGVRYANFSVNSNGLMRLGKSVVSNTGNNSLATGTNLPLLTAFWDNLNSYSVSSTSRVRNKVSGAAPNRILTVEWKDFIISNNSSSSTQLSTFQIRLYETSGIFEYVYGRMQIATGSSTVTASIGMTNSNANNGLIYLNSISAPSVLRTTAGVVNNLVNSAVTGNIANLNSVADGTRIKYTFTSVTPNAAPTGLNFTAVGTSSMTLNWTCAATNELGFAIYRSDDGGLTYNFVSQAAANATASVQDALSPSTTYFWKVYAVTEGALSSSVNGSQATIACIGAPVTNILALNTGGNINWSTAAAWSLGHSPTACEDALITFTRNSAATRTVTLDIPATVNSLTINGVYTSGGTKILQLLTGSSDLTVLGDLNISSTGGTGTSSEVDLLASNGSVITVNGNTTIGQLSDTRISYFGGVTGQNPDFHFKGNVTYNSNAGNSWPGSYYFDGGITQTLTCNANVYAVTFGNAEIGSITPTTLTLAGAMSYNIYTNFGNLSVNPASTLVIPYNATFNQYTAGNGSLVLKANSTLKLGDYFGGQAGSNFPLNFGNISIDPASTVEYYYTGSSSPVIYTAVSYGNLVLTNVSRKYINTDLFIQGNFTVNTGSTFGCNYGAYLYGSTMINNGIIKGDSTNSRFGFYGTTAQTYSGTGAFGTAVVPFGTAGIDIFNPANVTLNAAIYPYRLNLFNGSFINSNQLNIGTASFGLIQRGGASGYLAGSLDVYPVINCPNNLILRYDDASANITTGYEIPVSTNTNTFYSNNINGVNLTSDLTVSNDLELLQNTFHLGANTLKIGNVITKFSGNMIGSDGTVEMTGSTAQTIPSNTFVSNNLKNLVISNSNTVTGVTLAGKLDIYRSVTFGSAGRKLTTGGFLTFKSTASETAWLGQMTASNIIAGDAGIERYIPLHNKAWQLLSTPITASSIQTLKQAWQEGAATANGNPVLGYGTQLTSNIAGAATQPNPGFDVYTSTPSIKVFNAATNSYNRLDSTTGRISNPKGYMVFIRGDRSVITTGAGPSTTIMRTKGTLHTPANPPVNMNVAIGFESIGNPYASAIDFRSLTISGGVQTDFFYLWDPKLTTIGVNSSYGLGGFQTFSWNGSSFDVTPGGGSYAGSNRFIESGQAFFVNAPFAAGTVAFSESAKVNGSNSVNRVPAFEKKQLRTNMYVVSGTGRILLDGNLIQYDQNYSNAVDINDGIKLNNSGENLGITRDGKTLVVERRKLIEKTDTVFYKLGQLKIRQYQFEFIPDQLFQQGMAAFLEDKYMQTFTSVSLRDTTRFLFEITNIPGSYDADRFRLVFRKVKKKESQVIAGLNDNTDKNNDDKSDKKKGKVKETTGNSFSGINIYPNPVVNKTMNIHFVDQEAGNYNIQLSNKLGQLVYSGNVHLSSKQMLKSLQLEENIATGNYHVQIQYENGTKKTLQVFIQ